MVRPCNHAPHPLLQLSYYIYSLCHLVFKTPLYITLYKSSRPITNPSKTVLFTPSVLHNREPKKGTVKLHRIDGNEDTLHSQTKEPRKQVLPPHQSIIYLIMPSGMAGGAPITAPPPATPRLCRSMLASQPSRTNTYTRTTTFSRPYDYERTHTDPHTHTHTRNRTQFALHALTDPQVEAAVLELAVLLAQSQVLAAAVHQDVRALPFVQVVLGPQLGPVEARVQAPHPRRRADEPVHQSARDTCCQSHSESARSD